MDKDKETKGLTEKKLLEFITDLLSKQEKPEKDAELKQPSSPNALRSIKHVKVSYGTCKSCIRLFRFLAMNLTII